MKKFLAIFFLLTSIGLIGLAAFVTYDNIVGAYGAGPPYYSQTTNMDKWQNPTPYLIVFDSVVAVAAALLSRWSIVVLRKRKH